MKHYFPVQSANSLVRIGLMVKQARLDQDLRQIDLAEQAGATLRTVRRIEAGNVEGVSLRDFMIVLFILGLSERVFPAPLEGDPSTAQIQAATSDKRVRLRKASQEDF